MVPQPTTEQIENGDHPIRTASGVDAIQKHEQPHVRTEVSLHGIQCWVLTQTEHCCIEIAFHASLALVNFLTPNAPLHINPPHFVFCLTTCRAKNPQQVKGTALAMVDNQKHHISSIREEMVVSMLESTTSSLTVKRIRALFFR